MMRLMLRQGVDSLTQTHTLQQVHHFIHHSTSIFFGSISRDYPFLFIDVFVIREIELVVPQRHQRSLTVRWSFKESMCQSINDFEPPSVPFRNSIYVFQCYLRVDLNFLMAKYKWVEIMHITWMPKTILILTIFISPLKFGWKLNIWPRHTSFISWDYDVSISNAHCVHIERIFIYSIFSTYKRCESILCFEYLFVFASCMQNHSNKRRSKGRRQICKICFFAAAHKFLSMGNRNLDFQKYANRSMVHSLSFPFNL